MTNTALQMVKTAEGLSLSGPLTVQGGKAAKTLLTSLSLSRSGKSTVNLGGITHLDTVGALWLLQAQEKLGSHVIWSGLSADHKALLARVTALEKTTGHIPSHHREHPLLVSLGKHVCAVGTDLYQVFTLLGEVLVAFTQIAVGQRHFRVNAFARHVREAGINAIPIVALISFLMSIVLAYQGVAQLSMFGAQQYAINLVAVSTLREMGGLLAAIMVAGRSGSSFTSEIGVMKIREEVDALTVMGLNPLDTMILPRIAALIVVLPLLTFVAFLAGLLGGAVVSMASLGIGFGAYLKLYAAAVVSYTPWLGMVKAPVFALFIGLISCLAGLQVSGSADSVGRHTTQAVVKGIFSVLVVDAIFSIFFARMGW